MYGFFYIGITQARLAQIYGKSASTVSRWVNHYANDGELNRKESVRVGRFNSVQVEWVVQFFRNKPTAYLRECRSSFVKVFSMEIGISTIFAILQRSNFTRKVVERRALNIKIADVMRFTKEINSIDWMKSSLVFLDEVSFDNRGMVRKFGYAIKGERLVVRGEFTRKPRVSCLAFIGVGGLLDYFQVEGTFTRLEFIRCITEFATHCPKVRKFPGNCSIWILDGAKIHCHPDVVNLLRSFGIIPIFLPAYCPFYNPIEFVFGMIKNQFKNQYKEGETGNLPLFVNEIFCQYTTYDFTNIFNKCGYQTAKGFNPGCADLAIPEKFE